jgi:hypothetical protein
MKLIERKKRTEKTLAKFRGRGFKWDGGATCIHLFRTHLKNMGHKVPVVPRFTSALSAKRAMDVAGFKDLEALADSFLQRIPPSMMLLGDVALMESDLFFDDQKLFDAFVISAGPGGKVMGWHSDAPALANMEAFQIKAAWRV